MQVDWPYEFPGAYCLDKQEDRAVEDVLTTVHCFVNGDGRSFTHDIPLLCFSHGTCS